MKHFCAIIIFITTTDFPGGILMDIKKDIVRFQELWDKASNSDLTFSERYEITETAKRIFKFTRDNPTTAYVDLTAVDLAYVSYAIILAKL